VSESRFAAATSGRSTTPTSSSARTRSGRSVRRDDQARDRFAHTRGERLVAGRVPTPAAGTLSRTAADLPRTGRRSQS
jgi:hypothetical protein